MAKDKHRHPEHEPDRRSKPEDTYDIVEPIDEEPLTKYDPALAKRAAEERTDRGVDLDIDTDTPPPPPSGADYSQDGTGTPRPKLLEGIPEPKFVDPEVKSRRREEERVRAAIEQAEEDARRRAVKIKVYGTIALVLAVIGVIVYVFL